MAVGEEGLSSFRLGVGVEAACRPGALWPLQEAVL